MFALVITSYLYSCRRIRLSLDSEHVSRRLPDSHSYIHPQLFTTLHLNQYSQVMARKCSLFDTMARPV